MPLLRFTTAVLVRLVIFFAGLGLLAYAGMMIVTGVIVLMAVTNPSATFGHPAEPPLGWLATHFGTLGAVAIVGCVLMFIGVRGLVRRIRAGLPSDDEGMPKTPAGQLGSALIYGAGFAFGAFSIAVSAIPGAQMAILVQTGTTVDADVVSVEPTADPKQWIMTYTFTTPAGQTVTDTATADAKPNPNLRQAKLLQVSYLPSDPSQHAVSEYYSHESFVFFMVTRLLVAIGGLWGLMKVLSPPVETPPQAPPAPAERPLPTRVAVVRPIANGSRPMGNGPRTFGRRGA